MKLLYKLTLFFSLSVALVACDQSKKNNDAMENLPSFFIKKGNNYYRKEGNNQLVISASVAGRVSSLKIDDQELLLTPDFTKTSIWGNAFWTSPQSEWNWPPSESLDTDPYTVSYENDRLVLTSKVDEKTRYQFVKSYGINAEKKCISIRYSIYNRGEVEKNVAPWEVTRLQAGGIAFFPQGNTESTSGIFYPMPVEHIDGLTWSTYDVNNIRENHHKMLTDGKEGWIAFTNKGKLLVKEFSDVPVELLVAGEGEIELFANTEKTFWEVGQQGEMTTLAPGQHLNWEVLWYMRTLPENIKAKAGNPELVSFVRGVLRGDN